MQSSYVFLLLIVVIIIVAVTILYLYQFTDVFGKKYKLEKDEKNILKGATAVQSGLKGKTYKNYDFNTSNLSNEYIKVIDSIDSISNNYSDLETKLTSTSNLAAGLNGFNIEAHKSMYAVLENVYNGSSNVDTSLTRMLDAYKVEYDNNGAIYNYIIGSSNVDRKDNIIMNNDVIINSDLKICNTVENPRKCFTFSIDGDDLKIDYDGADDAIIKLKRTDTTNNTVTYPGVTVDPFTNKIKSYPKTQYMPLMEGFETKSYPTVSSIVDKKLAEKSNQWAIGYGNLSSKSKDVQKNIFNSAKGNNSIILTYKMLEGDEITDNSIKYIEVKDKKYGIYPFYRYIQPLFKKTVDGNVKHYIKYNKEKSNILEYTGTVTTVNITQNMFMPQDIIDTLKEDGVELIYIKHD